MSVILNFLFQCLVDNAMDYINFFCVFMYMWACTCTCLSVEGQGWYQEPSLLILHHIPWGWVPLWTHRSQNPAHLARKFVSPALPNLSSQFWVSRQVSYLTKYLDGFWMSKPRSSCCWGFSHFMWAYLVHFNSLYYTLSLRDYIIWTFKVWIFI